jgi:hypothetical protein
MVTPRRYQMGLPENVAVRYTEDEAEYVSLRPVVRQTFRIGELVDMIVTVTGLDAPRVAQILHAGSVAYHGYRYWWTGFEASAADLAGLLAGYPAADPARAFDAAACMGVIFESSGSPPRHAIEISRAEGRRRRVLRLRSFWDAVMELAARRPAYADYSYARRADLFALELGRDDVARLVAAAQRLAPRQLRARLGLLPEMARAEFVLPRR